MRPDYDLGEPELLKGLAAAIPAAREEDALFYRPREREREC